MAKDSQGDVMSGPCDHVHCVHKHTVNKNKNTVHKQETTQHITSKESWWQAVRKQEAVASLDLEVCRIEWKSPKYTSEESTV